MRSPRRGASHVAASIGQGRERAERRIEQPTEPDALALAECADTVHAVVPVASPDQRQSVTADHQAGIQRAGAVFEQRADFVGHRRKEEAVVFVGLQKLTLEERNQLVQHRGIFGRTDIMRDGIGQPRLVVGDARAHTLTRMRQPPVLHVTFHELPRGRAQQMFARHRRQGGSQCHAVLQLVTKAISAARLIERRAGPDATGQGLIQQPAVQHDVHRTVGSLHLHRT